MLHINSAPAKNGNYGNPRGKAFPGSLVLPDELLEAYLDSMGFVTPTVTDGAVTALERNEEAYEAYIAEHPVVPEPEPTEELLLELAADHEERICLLEMGVN